jgi:hypothetical protein
MSIADIAEADTLETILAADAQAREVALGMIDQAGRRAGP